MSLLNLHLETTKKKPSKNRLTKILGIAVLFGAVAFGSTFASNISLNGNQNVEFGQGLAATTSCDDEITITPFSTFVNEVGAGSHKLTSIEVSGIDSSSEKCSGKTFTIRAYGESGQLNLFRKQYINVDNPPVYQGYEDYDTIEISDADGVFTWVSGGTDGDDVITPPDQDIHNTSFTLSLSSALGFLRLPLASAQDVKRITIETRDSVYQVGDYGPGGGTVIYDAGTRQNWGRYIEVAPDNWNGSSGDDVNVAWCSDSALDVNSSSTGIGNGKSNTDRMVGSNCSSGAGVIARGYHGGGKNDWSLPSRAEMQLVFSHANILFGLTDQINGYWVSNGGTGADNWVGTVVTSSGAGGVNKAYAGPYIRPIRLF